MGISVNNLFFDYGKNRVLNDITFQAPEGKFSVLLGKNGSGKSTLLKIIAGLLPYKKGEIRILENDLRSLKLSETAKLIGYLPQFHVPAFPFTAEEVVLTGRASYVYALPGRRDLEKRDEAIDKVGIGSLRHRPYTELSGGERQLVMIARVLAQEPRVILLDEPLSHLDLSNQTRLLALVRELIKSGLTVMAVLHDPNVAFMQADHFILIKKGAIRHLEKNENPWDESVLGDLYEVPVRTISFQQRALVLPV